MMPAVIHDLSYEVLVRDQARETKALLEYCGLPWERECLDFGRNATASTTASAAQVRQPIYSASVGRWRHYEQNLGPLREILLAGGLDA